MENRLGLKAQFRKKGVLKHLQDAAALTAIPAHSNLSFWVLSNLRSSGQDGELSALTNEISLHQPHVDLASDFSTCRKVTSQLQVLPVFVLG